MNEVNLRLNRERRFLVLLGVICLSLIGGALYMQIVLGEAPLSAVHPATLCAAVHCPVRIHRRGDARPYRCDRVRRAGSAQCP